MLQKQKILNDKNQSKFNIHLKPDKTLKLYSLFIFQIEALPKQINDV